MLSCLDQKHLFLINAYLINRAQDKAGLEVKLKQETVWLSQAQMCDLLDKDRRTISEHIKNIYKEKTFPLRQFYEILSILLNNMRYL